MKHTTFILIDGSGVFYAETAENKRTFLHNGAVMDVNSLPGGCWPVVYNESETGNFLYFTYFLSSALHKWKLNEDGSRGIGLGVGTGEFCDLLISIELDGLLSAAREHILSKVRQRSILLDSYAQFDNFIISERILSAWILKCEDSAIPDFQILLDELETAKVNISNFTHYSNVAKDYQSKLSLHSDSTSLKEISAHEFLSYLDFDFIKKIQRELISDLNKDKEFCLVEFKLGKFTNHLAEVVEVRKIDGNDTHLCPLGWIIDIGLSRQILRNREVRESWLKRIKVSLNTLKHDILEFFNTSSPSGKLRLAFGDGGNLISKTITFDSEVGTEQIAMPDLYILTERPVRRFFSRPRFSDFETSFKKKRLKLFWRGSTTGALGNRDIEGLRSNFRVKACVLSKQMSDSRCDMKIVYIAGIKPEYRTDAENFLIESGIKGDPVPENEFGKNQIYIDLPGNVAAWGTYRKYLFGCVVLRPPSDRHLLYYELLVPWVHFIPLHDDLRDLGSKVEWVAEHQGEASRIAFAGRNALIDYISGLSVDIQTAFRAGFEATEVNVVH